MYVCQSIQVNCCAGPVHYLVDDTYLVQYMVDVHTTYSIHEIEQATNMITDQATNALNAWHHATNITGQWTWPKYIIGWWQSGNCKWLTSRHCWLGGKNWATMNSERTHLYPKLKNNWGLLSLTFDLEWQLQRYLSQSPKLPQKIIKKCKFWILLYPPFKS